MQHKSQDLLLAVAATLMMTADAVTIDCIKNLQMNVFQSPVNLDMTFGDTIGGSTVYTGNTMASPDAMDSPDQGAQDSDQGAQDSDQEPAEYEGTPIPMPEVSIPYLTCLLYPEENYQGTPQTVGYSSNVLEFTPVKSVACAVGTRVFVTEEGKEDAKYNAISSRGVPSLEGNPTD